MDFIVLVWLSPSSFLTSGEASLAVLSVLSALFSPFKESLSSLALSTVLFYLDLSSSGSSESDDIGLLSDSLLDSSSSSFSS